MSRGNNLLSVDRNGEFMYNILGSHIKKKYKEDTLLDKSFIPYLIMAFCMVVDASVFINLFKMISYDSPFMIGIEVSGFLFAFDVVPLYIGIQFRRLKQRISRDKFIMWLALSVCVLACLLNFALRIMTIDLMSSDFSSASTSYFGMVTETSASSSDDPTAIALTIFGIVLPMITSIGSFFISYTTYNPLKIRKRQLEEILIEKEDECRRLNAIYNEYELNQELAENIVFDDEGKFEAEKKKQRALVISYCEFVKQRLKEYLANPAALSALSEDNCIEILKRLEKGLIALDKTEIPKNEKPSFVSNGIVA